MIACGNRRNKIEMPSCFFFFFFGIPKSMVNLLTERGKAGVGVGSFSSGHVEFKLWYVQAEMSNRSLIS